MQSRRCLPLLRAFIVLSVIQNLTHAMSIGKSGAFKRLAVIGATGKLGRQAVKQIVDEGIPCKILLRRPIDPEEAVPGSLEECSTSSQVAAYFNSLPLVTVVQGDVTDVDSLTELTKDCDACLGLWGSTRRSKISDLFQNYKTIEDDPSHAKQVNYQGVLNLMEACRRNPECQRIVRVTGKGEDPTGIFSILINMLGSMAKAWNYQGEFALREGTTPYTIVRPGVMGEEGPTGNVLKLVDNGGDMKVAKVSYTDIARLCVNCLAYENAKQTTLTAMTTDDETVGTSSWEPWLSKVQADSREFPTNMLQQHYDAVGATVKKIIGASAALVFLCAALIVRALS